jgi:hypothetical protein
LRGHTWRLAFGHQRPNARRLAAEGAEIGRGIAKAEQRRAVQSAPARADAMRQQPAHRLAECGRIKVLQIADIELHGWMPWMEVA